MANLNKLLFHGSYTEIVSPKLDYSRSDIDFGKGFYLTNDKYQATKWACKYRKNEPSSFINAYKLDISELKIYQFSLDTEWLDFVIANREGLLADKHYSEYDVLIGAVADDKMFDTISLYSRGFISKDITLKILNCMDYGEQIVLRTETALKKLHFDSAKEITGQMKDHYRMCFKQDAIDAHERTEALLKEYNERKYS